MAPEDWQPRLSSDCHTHTGMSSCSHMNIHIFRNTCKAIWFDDCIRCVLTGILFWSEPLINARCLFTTWPQTEQKQRQFSVTCHQALLRVLKYFATCSTYASVAAHYGLYNALEFHSCQCRHFWASLCATAELHAPSSVGMLQYAHWFTMCIHCFLKMSSRTLQVSAFLLALNPGSL